ncbi:MAG: Response regulator receiver protein [uncultured Thiotrichaceae bacterium]|uniref:Response regulator receiver protein n=1 Tax=uncultured Thiotrichaceae bacterium TaxID=298394 RepID=A0A6S6S4T6_9GAMM|nr:MAG: Response regulator receiver protein [uncultured Thiotrichaceae bacterium]
MLKIRGIKMNIINSKNNIRVHFVGLQQKERTVFDRVISFEKKNGLNVQVCANSKEANLFITTETAFSALNSVSSGKIVLVITKDSSLGDVQVASPLLITRVMKALEKAIKLVDDVKSGEEKSAEAGMKTSKPAADHANIEVCETSDGRLHALVIDDSASIRKQLELELRSSEIAADFAESGEQALEKIKERSFDLIFLDIMMPGINGYETCKLIRLNAVYKKTPIIMLSGKTSPLDEVEGIIAGATTYLTKPVKSDKFQEVLARVSSWINNFKIEKENKKTAVKC